VVIFELQSTSAAPRLSGLTQPILDVPPRSPYNLDPRKATAEEIPINPTT
jgi:hypothetical protein